MSSYKIIRWDPVLFPKSNDPTPIPVICIKPDQNLLDFAKENNNTFLVEILNTNNVYENKKIVATFTKSSDALILTNGLYSLALQCEWYGYPDCSGDCKIYGIKGGIKSETINNVELRTPKENIQLKNTNYTGMNNSILYAIFTMLFIVLCVVLIFK